MNSVPTISVIVPTCNRVSLALECVRSILDNDYTDFELIVVDQPSDDTLETELCRRFPHESRLHYVCIEQRAASAARNAGIRRARGEILVFADDDVEVAPGWLRAYVETFAALEPQAAMVMGRLDPRWMAPRPTWLGKEREYLLGIYAKGDTMAPIPESDLPISANLAFSRRIADEVGVFDERLGYSYSRRYSMIGGEDSLLGLRVKKAGYPIYYQPAAQAWHKIGKNKLTRRYFLRRHYWEGVTLLSVLYLSGSIKQEDALSVVGWHAREMARHALAFFPTAFGPHAGTSRSSNSMRTLSQFANSAGIIVSALKLRLGGRLP